LQSNSSAEKKNNKINKQADKLDSAVDEYDTYINTQQQRKTHTENNLAQVDKQLQHAEANNFNPEQIDRLEMERFIKKHRVIHYNNKIEDAQTRRSALHAYALLLRTPVIPKGMRATPISF